MFFKGKNVVDVQIVYVLMSYGLKSFCWFGAQLCVPTLRAATGNTVKRWHDHIREK